MGHASIATTNLYLHHLGTGADRAGLERLNRPGHTGGTRSAMESESHRPDLPRLRVSSLVRPNFNFVELRGFEPLTFSLRTRRATDCAIAPETGSGPISTQTLPSVTRMRPRANRRRRSR